MSSYPPPPSGQYPPPYDRNAWKAQRAAMKAQARAIKAQARIQRAQLRVQRRGLRRRSIVGPIILLSMGVVFLLAQIGKFSWGQSLEWYARWWPAVLIVAGILLLIEWLIDESLARQRPDGTRQVRVMGGGVVALLIFLAFVGLAAHGAVALGLDWHDHNWGSGYTKFDHLFGDRHDGDSSASSEIESGATLVIRDPHGDVTVTGDSPDNQVHVSEHTQSYAWKDSDALQKAEQMRPAFTGQGKELSLNIAAVEGGQSDLTVQIPKTTSVTIQTDRGDTNVSGLQASVMVSANHGDVDVSDVDASVSVHVNDSDASVTLHDLNGPVSVEGHSGDIDVTEVTGDLTLHGDFFGTTHLSHVNGGVQFETSRTKFSVARLDDEFSVDRDSLNASEMLGPLVLQTADKNISLDRVQGSVNIVNRNGSVDVTNSSPLAPISIANTHGSVDLGLPSGAGFLLNAETRNGDMENDFGLSVDGDGSTHTLQGKVHGGGPTIKVTTSDGDVTVRRSSAAPLAPPAPPSPPAPPKLTNQRPPIPPRPPAQPKRPAAEINF